MSYCSDEKTSWASISEIYDRYGDEFVDKLSIRRKYDTDVQSYVADETKEGLFKVQMLALCDAKDLILEKLSCKFSNLELLDTNNFPSIKQWHIRLTVETLKAGGDCRACACIEDLNKFVDCNSICDDAGVCLKSKKTFISVSTPVFKCECKGGCRCC